MPELRDQTSDDETIVDTPTPGRMVIHGPYREGWLPDGWYEWTPEQRGQWLSNRYLVMYRGYLIDVGLWVRDPRIISDWVDSRIARRRVAR
jgi:hypothetical protein